ncbi:MULTISPECIES: pitrilysin family protein [unclassified Wenzhouxiangella]|uniref:M16 family metallopeptidase n=1 Tax=unclassified Wenzhouxiangella TaxID=2613841 RepID=UPI0015F26A38|nr:MULTISPECIES: pitrilysin family protein [unclassified Wenzhouxiangella]
MNKRFGFQLAAGLVVMALLGAGTTAQSSNEQGTANLGIDYEKRVLDNGLTVIAHHDDKAPVVAVNVWYHVGSKNEPVGRSGFAHLFEHLMFNGTENYDDEYFKPFDRVGATGMNGTTNFDRTNYFQVVPNTALDLALWMESDRMGHLLGAVTQDRLDEQRGVVQNEKRQRENQPYGQVFNLIINNLFPQGHPYDHSVIGSMEDLNAASLDDVHDWFENYYGAANATIVIAGDIEPEEAFDRVERFFGHIPAGPPVDTPGRRVPQLDDSLRVIHEDRVPQTRIYKVWPVPGYGRPEADMLELASDVLADGQNSRLYKRLVYDEQIATDVSAFFMRNEVSGIFLVQASVAEDADAETVEAALEEELDRFVSDGPAEAELDRIQSSSRADFLRGLERVGGFGGKSDVLASSEVFLGRPDAWEEGMNRLLTAGSEDVRKVADDWLNRNHFTLEVRPYPDYGTVESDVDRSALPEVTEFPEADFPKIQRLTLDNGLEVVLAERHTLPVVEFDLRVNAGYASDQFGRPGTAKLAMNLVDQGAGELSALEIDEQLDLLGAELSSGANIDQSFVSMSALRDNLGDSLALFAEITTNPAFPAEELERQRSQMLANLRQEMNQPQAMALRVFPRRIFGEDHAYGQPLTGSGTEESVAAIGLEDLREHHRTWFRPNNATLVVAGDITLDELKPHVQRLFGDWQRGDVPKKALDRVDPKTEGQTVYVVDRPGAQQSFIVAGHLVAPKGGDEEFAIQAVNEVLGGSFNARLNMNLREDKGWSYGARTLLQDTAAQRPFVAFAPVQTDRTADSMAEIRQEFQAIVGDQPPEEDEVSRARDSMSKTLPGRWETIGAVASDLGEIVRFDLSDDYWDRYPGRVQAIERDQVVTTARNVVQPEHLVWVVVGDSSEISDPIRELGYDIRYVDANGDPVER